MMMNCTCFTPQPQRITALWLVLIASTHEVMARLSWPGWLVTYREKCPTHWELNLDTVTHPSINWNRRRLTWLIETNVLPLRQTTTLYCCVVCCVGRLVSDWGSGTVDCYKAACAVPAVRKVLRQSQLNCNRSRQRCLLLWRSWISVVVVPRLWFVLRIRTQANVWLHRESDEAAGLRWSQYHRVWSLACRV